MSLSALLERVEGATGPDREIEARLWCWVEGLTFRKLIWSDYKYPDGQKHWHSFRTSGGDKSCHGVPRYTASVDAALALIGRVLPGCSWKLEARWARIYTADDAYSGSAPTPALALCAALLAAMIGEEAKP